MIHYKAFLALLSFTTIIYADQINYSEYSNVDCQDSPIDYNIVFQHAHHAGRFQKAKNISDMASCIGKCCITKDCDVAFMSRDNCYMVDCHTGESCATKKLTRPKYETMLSFVTRPRKVMQKLIIPSKVGKEAGRNNLEENSSRMDEPFEFKPTKKDKILNLKQHSPPRPRALRSEAIDVMVAVASSLVAVIAAIIVIFTVLRRLTVERRDHVVSFEYIK